ncbi:MAG: hypothetical protein IPM82_15255 [Saprospiraceae bacterium]|nr:hypothetical protein [Saprospiraceae bacterium]
MRSGEPVLAIVDCQKATQREPVVEGFERPKSRGTPTEVPEVEDSAMFTGKGGEEEPAFPSVQPGVVDDCPDIYFRRLQIIEQDG